MYKMIFGAQQHFYVFFCFKWLFKLDLVFRVAASMKLWNCASDILTLITSIQCVICYFANEEFTGMLIWYHFLRWPYHSTWDEYYLDHYNTTAVWHGNAQQEASLWDKTAICEAPAWSSSIRVTWPPWFAEIYTLALQWIAYKGERQRQRIEDVAS